MVNFLRTFARFGLAVTVCVASATLAGYHNTSYVYSAPASANTYSGVPNLHRVNCATGRIEHSYDGVNQRVSVTQAGVKAYEVYGSHGTLLAEATPSHANRLVEHLYLGRKRIAQRQTATASAAVITTFYNDPSASLLLATDTAATLIWKETLPALRQHALQRPRQRLSP